MSINAYGEDKVKEIIQNLMVEGIFVPPTVADISSLPVKTYDQLFQDGLFSIHRFSTRLESGLFYMLATKWESLALTTIPITGYIIFVSGIFLAVSVSWSFLLLCALLPICLSLGKNIYNHVILRSAVHSEIIFCFLYFCEQIAIQDNQTKEIFFWKR